LEICKRLTNKKHELINSEAEKRGNPRTETRLVSASISGGRKKRKLEREKYEEDRQVGDALSVTRCHHVAFSGSFAPQVIPEP